MGSVGVVVLGAGAPGLSGGGSLGAVAGGVGVGGSVVVGGVVGGAMGAGVGVAAVGVGVGVLEPSCSGGGYGADAISGAGGSAIDTLGASIIVSTCKRPALAIAHIHRCARRLDTHVLNFILRAPKLASHTPT